MNKKNLTIFSIAILFLIITTGILLNITKNNNTWRCQSGEWVKIGNPKTDIPKEICQKSNLKVEPKTDDPDINIVESNQASNNCLHQGGKIEGYEDEYGKVNICVFKDGTRCEVWDYLNNICQPGKNIIVFNPRKKMPVSLPIRITGQARVFENSFNYRLKDGKGGIIASGNAMSNSPDAGVFGNFDIRINAISQNPVNNNLTLEVFDYSAKDGSEMDLVSLPLIYQSEETINVKVYFLNDKLDPEITCTKVFPVQRIMPKIAAVGYGALELLINGPNSEEYQQGYRTSINDGVKVQSLNIKKGVAEVDFDDTLQNQVGGSCRVSAIRAQISETLKQFPTVNNVIISIDDRTEDILQP